VKSHGPDYNTKRFSIWRGNPLASGIPRHIHVHHVNQFDEIGLPGEFCMIVNSLIVIDDFVRPNEAFLKIKEIVLDCFPSDHWLRPHILVDELWEALKEQVRNYMKYKRSKSIREYTLHTIQDIVDICHLYSPQIPVTYLPQDNFESAEELAEALNVKSVDTMLLSTLVVAQCSRNS
jgi:hypothetical protein